jgi:hypothetical protein
MGILGVLSLGMIGSKGGGGLGQGQLQVLELYGRCEFVDRLAAHSITIKGLFDVSDDGDDTARPQHL